MVLASSPPRRAVLVHEDRQVVAIRLVAGDRRNSVLCREVLEETGLTVTASPGTPDSTTPHEAASGHGSSPSRSPWATGPVALTEHDDSIWADRGDLPAVSDETRALLAG
ncbi:hypothetical protein SMICM17S_08059 [Streptomyces microflavus]